MGLSLNSETWSSLPILRIEDLQNAVLGAGLEATQMSTGALSGSLAFAQADDIVYSSGFLHGHVGLRGPLSQDLLTVGLGLDLRPGTRHWLEEVFSGSVGVFHGGDQHDSVYTSGSLYATATLSIERLEEIAADEELVLNRPILGGTGRHPRRIAPALVQNLRHEFEFIHSGRCREHNGTQRAGEAVLRAIINHTGRAPVCLNQRGGKRGYGRIVGRARDYIAANLAAPISPDDIARAAFTSRRTLFRAFAEVLDETPQSYTRCLRLHRIRHDLASEEERACTIALIANQWGMSDLGRMAGWYRELFGERPSETAARLNQAANRLQ
ncbi:MAG: helix-turn-helix domain-containing protein [Parvibaculaceae bacterium]